MIKRSALLEDFEADRYAFLTGGPMHHEIALQEVGTEAPQPGRYHTGLYHVAFEVPDQRAFAQAYRALTEAGVSGDVLRRPRPERARDLRGHPR